MSEIEKRQSVRRKRKAKIEKPEEKVKKEKVKEEKIEEEELKDEGGGEELKQEKVEEKEDKLKKLKGLFNDNVAKAKKLIDKDKIDKTYEVLGKSFEKAENGLEKSFEKIKAGADIAIAGFDSAEENAAKLWVKGRLKTRVFLLRFKIKKFLTKLGTEVYDQNAQGVKDILQSENVKKAMSQAEELKKEISTIEKKMEEAK